MNKRRLLTLAKFLETKVPRKRFDMTWWGYSKNRKPGISPASSCRTTACALGWATAIPDFRRAGLRMISDYSVRFTTSDGEDAWGFYVAFGKVLNISAACLFFDMTFKEAASIFQGSRGTPKQVAARIRKLVADA